MSDVTDLDLFSLYITLQQIDHCGKVVHSWNICLWNKPSKNKMIELITLQWRCNTPSKQAIKAN